MTHHHQAPAAMTGHANMAIKPLNNHWLLTAKMETNTTGEIWKVLSENDFYITNLIVLKLFIRHKCSFLLLNLNSPINDFLY